MGMDYERLFEGRNKGPDICSAITSLKNQLNQNEH